MTSNIFSNLIKDFRSLPAETEWLEFKRNRARPDEIGENISALSNSSALLRKYSGYIVWGIEDDNHTIVGTDFLPREKKVGNEELENWLLRNLDPRIDIKIHEGEVEEKHIVLFEIQAAVNRPVRFKDNEYIRVGSYTKKLRDFPEKERNLWRIFDRVQFEEGFAKKDVSSDDVLSLIDYSRYFSMMKEPLPDNRTAILQRLSSENIMISVGNNRYDIKNVGAILFAKDLNDFERLFRKSLRVIVYRGNSRTETVKEHSISKGYALGFEGAMRYISDQLPQNEEIGVAFRKEVRMYPQIAIRELVANALIHQDFHITGAGPTVEIFSDRMEITNPGVPLIDTLRFIDEPPRSRNEQLAALMRRMAICEERGSGIDKVIFNIEVFQLPAPDFRASTHSTITVLYGPRKFSKMKREERIRACYQHACLQYVSGGQMTNASLRKRLGIKDSNYPAASRILKDAITSGLIKSKVEGAGSKRDSSYLPFWA
ncbi:MAG: putative DNA binding domain-containing protein [Candidatus Scalindua sp.]|nr:putative DNA binding domain-containing protein [Candidatus Scalindua sp.]